LYFEDRLYGRALARYIPYKIIAYRTFFSFITDDDNDIIMAIIIIIIIIITTIIVTTTIIIIIIITILSIKSEFLPEYIKLRAMPVLPGWRISWRNRLSLPKARTVREAKEARAARAA
jgi:hypothetical protein